MKLCMLIPSLNQADFLESSVRSVVDQISGQEAIDVCLMDGGSKADVLAIIERLEREYSDLKVHSRPDKGQADALARGFAATDADILGWLNSDDLVFSGTLQKVMDEFRRRPEVDVIYGDALFIDEAGVCVDGYPTAPFDPELLKSFCYLSQPSVFFRKTAYTGAGGVNTKLNYAVDYDLWLRLLASGARFHYLPEFLSATRLHSQTKTATGPAAFTQEVQACQSRHFPQSRHAGRELWRSYRKLISKVPALPRSAAVGLAWMRYLVYWKQIPESSSWVYRVGKLHWHATKRAKPYLGRKFPGPRDGRD